MKWINDHTLNHLAELFDHPDLSGTRYRLIDKIAVGGMGAIYRVEDTELRRVVALKVINHSIVEQTKIELLMREARTIAQLEHPGIIPVYDVGLLQDGRAFYTMKLVKGIGLNEYHKSKHSIPELLRIYLKICDAVAYAHSHDVIHRDLKPGNVMIGEFGEVLVMDWGLAWHLTDNFDEHKNPSGTDSDSEEQRKIAGTPAFMSPEQAAGKNSSLDKSTDIYGLGAILYYLLTGSAPYTSDSVEAIRHKVLHDSPVAPRELDRSIAKSLNAICMKAMAKSRGDRYENAGRLIEDIENYLDQKTVSAYEENIFDRIKRIWTKYQFIFAIILAYLIMRILLLFWPPG